MLRLALLLLSLPLLAHGGAGIYDAVRNREMKTVTCPQFMTSPPKARWLRVTGCEFDYTHPAIIASGDRITQLYFGMRIRNGRRDAPVSLIVATRDPEALAAAQQALGGGAAVDDEAFTVAMLRVVGILRAAREIDGYARDGLVEGLITRRDLAEFPAPRTARLTVLDLHARPSFVLPGIEAGTGLVLLIATAAVHRRRPATPVMPSAQEPAETLAPVAMLDDAAEPSVDMREHAAETAGPPVDISQATPAAETEPEALPEEPIPPQPHPAVPERRLPRAMLLNLDASASVNAIESAPPLGNQQEVAARIAAVLGPLTENGGGAYSVTGADWRLDLDLGREDSVWTATVDARGSEAALDALDRLARDTNWRVFVPRLGTFR